MQPLSQSFFQKDTCRLAERLLGCYVVRKRGALPLIGRIVETEAYLGLKDPSCHSFHGKKTERVKTMYLPAGCSYIYLIYGVHHCFNVVSGSEKEPEAVLIRALEPIQGILEMKKRRKGASLTALCQGPGKLCQALHITKAWNGKKLFQSPGAALNPDFYLSKGDRLRNIETGPRIGLSMHADSAYWPLRFFLKENPFVSGQKNR